jgi:hypothetical protein
MRKLLLTAFLLATLAGCASQSSVPGGPLPATVPGLAEGVHFAGGDGSSQEHAVIVLGATEPTGVEAEYLWLRVQYPGYKLIRQGLIQGKDGKSFDILEFSTPDGAKHSVYFDITDYFGKM